MQDHRFHSAAIHMNIWNRKKVSRIGKYKDKLP